MTAQTGDVGRPFRDGGTVMAAVAANARIYQGALLEIDSAGRVKPATKGSNRTYFGVAIEPANNASGAAGAIEVTLRRNVMAYFKKSATAVIGKKAYVVDDQTVTDSSTSASACGLIIGADDDGVWVDLGSQS